MKNKTYFVITIDVECDKCENWQIKQLISFESVLKGIPDILQPLFNKYGIKPTYLLSPEVIMNDKCVSILKSLSMQDKIELGTHLHGEFIEPNKNYNPIMTSDFQCYYPAKIEFAKLSNLTRLFEEKFGYKPKSFRAGRFGASGRTIKFLEELGYLVDSSVTPFTIWRDSAGTIDFLQAPVNPYFPSTKDITIYGNSKVLEVPVTILPQFLNPKFGNHFSFLKKKHTTKKIWKRFFGTIWLRPTWSSTSEMIHLIKRFRKLNEPNKPLVLNMMFHSVEVIPGASPYNKTIQDVQRFLSKLEEVLSYLANIKAAPLLLTELYKVLQPSRSGDES